MDQSEDGSGCGCWIDTLPAVREPGFPKPRTTGRLVLVSIEELRFSNGATFCFQCGILSDVLGERPFLKELWHYSTMEIGLA